MGHDRDPLSYLAVDVGTASAAHTAGTTIEGARVDTRFGSGVVAAQMKITDINGGSITDLRMERSTTGLNDSVGAATQSVGSGRDDATSGGTYVGTTDSTFTITLDSINTADGIDDATVQTVGTGTDDITPSGTYVGITDSVINISISLAAGTDEFDWDVDGSGGATGVAMTGAAQALGATGVSITWGSTTGHTLNDAWTLGVSPDKFTWNKDGGTESSAVLMTGAAQTLQEGVTVTWAATTGHTATNEWTIAVTADVFEDIGGDITNPDGTAVTLPITANGTYNLKTTQAHGRYVRCCFDVLTANVTADVILVRSLLSNTQYNL